MLRGVLAAALTPLRDGGASLDRDAFSGYTAFLEAAGLDGVFALGSTGEGLLLSTEERMRAAETFRACVAGRLAVHCGALATGEAVVLAEHAASIGADAVAAVAPPYYGYGDDELLEHFAAIADACAPLPFYVYEFAERTGYAVSPEVVRRLAARASNLAGLKVSDTPFDRVRPYLIEGLDVFVGSEPLLPEGLAAGAVGAVSALASVRPDVVVELVRAPSAAAAERARETRASFSPFISAAKASLAREGLMRADVRRPLLPSA